MNRQNKNQRQGFTTLFCGNPLPTSVSAIQVHSSTHTTHSLAILSYIPLIQHHPPPQWFNGCANGDQCVRNNTYNVDLGYLFEI